MPSAAATPGRFHHAAYETNYLSQKNKRFAGLEMLSVGRATRHASEA